MDRFRNEIFTFAAKSRSTAETMVSMSFFVHTARFIDELRLVLHSVYVHTTVEATAFAAFPTFVVYFHLR